ncbi:MAG: DNA-formamidopyrimidine glycosylase family protein [Actinomycetota bacterium]
MPELPDVEGFRRFFEKHATAKPIRRVRGDPAIVRNASPRSIDRAIAGRTFETPDRIGKWLICRVAGPAVLFHFGMTGDFLWDGGEEHPHDRLVIVFDDGELRYRDMRKFGGVWLARDEGGVQELTGYLGPDALAVTRAMLDNVLDHRAGLKAVLMEQRNIAGLGNLLVDETLWRARIAPTRTASALSTKQRDSLYRAMRHVLIAWCRDGFVPGARSWLTGHRTRGGRCPRCKTKLTRATVAGRTTYWCRHCQR